MLVGRSHRDLEINDKAKAARARINKLLRAKDFGEEPMAQNEIVRKLMDDRRKRITMLNQEGKRRYCTVKERMELDRVV